MASAVDGFLLVIEMVTSHQSRAQVSSNRIRVDLNSFRCMNKISSGLLRLY